MLATSIVVPMAVTISHADEENIQQVNINEENTNQRSIDYRTITGNSVNFRKGPGTNYSSISKLNKGYKVEYIGKSGSWINVKYNGQVGYVHGDYVSTSGNSNITPPTDNSDDTIKSTKVVNGNSVNFRKGPSTSYSSIGKLNKGDKVGYISESNGWSKISYNGQIGYMSSQYLSTSGENVNPPSGNTDESVKSTKVVNGNSVNFRKGPSTSYSSIGKLNKGYEVGYISESSGWSKIKYNGQIGYISSQYLGNKDDISSGGNNENLPSSEKADKVINFGKTLLGKPYVWGAEGPNSFDCSGFTQYVFKKSVGVSIPRVSRDQSKFGQSVSRSNLQKGDLIFFDTDGSNNGYVSHVGIYMGGNQFIHASSSGKKVIISNMTSYYNNAFVNARRVL
ncbi:C40 family peptidase [Romboutsia lituseburensis]|uniref:C40 family peptidase n=1 Tax=Romboutsia lituseburensis TaxID=1537 RepID=UPI00215B46C8|nr:C40 family peptidase [Romboutsia lituseburensis]MCR8746609.1 SH3 domain-containing protein [Romboutsia lituseburensis]